MSFALNLPLEIYPSLSFDSKQSKRVYYWTIIVELIVYLQNIQLFWNANLNISGWRDFQGFWTVLCSPALSNILSSLSPLPTLFFIILSVLGFLLTLLTLAGILNFFRLKTNGFMNLSIRCAIHIVGKLCFIPIVLLLIKFYNEGIDGYFNAQSEYFRLVVATELSFVTFLAFLYETVQYELRPLGKETFSTSKINVGPDLFIRTVEVLNCVFVTYITDNYYSYYLGSCVVSYGLSFSLMIKYLPYYSKNLNICKSFSQLSLASISLFFYMGYLNNSAFLIVALTVLMQPMIAIAAYVLINKRCLKVQKIKKPYKKSFNVFELSIRPELRKASENPTLKKLSKNFKLTKNKYAVVLSSYYCQDILENYSLALNKINRASYNGLNFPLNYQIYKAKVSINKHSKGLSISHKLYEYIKGMLAVKLEDEKFCKLYQTFFYTLLKNSLKLSELKKLVNEIVRQWKTLSRKYKDILKNFPFSREIRDMYATLLDDIRGSRNKSLKASQIQIRNEYRALLKQSFASNFECLAMFSADKGSFGKVRFLSKEFIKKFRIPKDLKTELEISSVVPEAFYKLLQIKLLELTYDDTNNTLYETVFIYLQDSSGFLHECKVNIHYIQLSKQTNFIISVFFLNKNRNFALVTTEGLIHGHSELFTPTLGLKKTLLTSTYIRDTVPSIDMKHLLAYKYDEICIASSKEYENESNIQLELKTFSFFEQQFCSLYLFKDAIYCDFDSEGFSGFFEIEKGIGNTEVFDDFKEQESMQQFFDAKQENNESTSNTQGLITKEIDSLNRSRLVMKMTKVILLILVRITQVILMISSNIAGLVIVNAEVNHSVGLDAMMNLNYLAYALVKVSVIVRSFDVYSYLDQTQYFTYEDYGESIQNLIKYQKLVLDDYSQWKYCSASRMVKEQVLAHWDYKSINASEIKYTDLYNFVDFIRENADAVVAKIKKEENYNKEMANVISNTQAGPLNTIIQNIDEFIECETNRSKNLDSVKVYFLLAGSISIALSFLFTSIYLFWSDRHLNILWENLRTRAHLHSEKLQNLIKQRLQSYHDEIQIEDYTADTPQNRINFMHSLRFLAKLSWLFAASIVMLILSSQIFYEHVKDHLYHRPSLIGAFSSIEVQMSRLSFTVLEKYATGSNYSFEEHYPNWVTLNPPQLHLKSALSALESYEEIITEPWCKDIMSQELWDLVFYRVSNVSAFVQKGSLRAMKYLHDESQFNLCEEVSLTSKHVDDFVGKVNEFNEKVQKTVMELGNADLTSEIKEDLKKMVYFVVFFSLLLLLSYFFYYWPMVQNEIEVIKSLTEVIKLMPKS